MTQLAACGIRLGRAALGAVRVATPLVLSVCLALASGCSASAESGSAGQVPAGGAGGTGGTAGNTALPNSLAFEPGVPLTLFPGETRTLAVRAHPAGAYPLRFALLGEPKNASLDRSEAFTEVDGLASVRVTAPTSPTTFSIRASAGSTVTAQVPVSVSDSGFVVLQVEPSYSGERSVSYWTASVRTGTTCAALTGNPPPDGDLVAQSLADQSPQIQGVPVGPALAVTLRAASFASGCADVAQVKPDEINHVTVTVVDRPLQMSETNLHVSLGIDTAGDDWRASLAANVEQAATAMRGSAPDEITALLDAMKLAASDAPAFALARSAGSWDAVIKAALGVMPFRARVLEWMTAGTQALEGTDVFTGVLASAGKDTDLAILTLGTVAGIGAKLAGFSTIGIQGTWTADPGDTVLFGTKLFWTPSRLVTALSLAPARVALPTAMTVAEALSETLSCAEVATLMTTGAAAAGIAFEGCDAACAERLCTTAIGTLWQSARDASGVDAASLQVVLTGKATIDEAARPIGFSGSWVGSLGSGATSASISGLAVGAAPPPPN